ncbi:kelch-like protein 23 isoform X2 [Lycorma delicatula]|uniref:kelch-like protein 23 isoform X2 n=1 Tax=Lycorma delicatula TaxID=130591 RepID=UPI003F51A8CF
MAVCKTRTVFELKLHSCYLLNNILKFREPAYLCDVNLVVNGKRLCCQKMKLVAESPYFKAMFDSHMKESRQEEITINGIDFYALEAVINYFDTSKIIFTEENICDIIQVVDLLQITSIRPLCDKFLSESLKSTNCISIYNLSSQYNFSDISTKAFQYMLENFCKIYEEDDFLQATFDVVFKILSSEYLNVDSENQLCYAIRYWVNYDIKSRKKHLPDLFQILDLEKISSWLPLDDVDGCLIDLGLINMELCFAIGGLTVDNNNDLIPLRSIEVLHKNKGWRLDKPNSFDYYEAVSTMAHCCFFPAIATSDKLIYIIGGNDGTGPVDHVECYKRNKWEILPSLPHGLEGAAAACVNKRIYVTGGFNQNIGITNKVWFYEEGFTKWREASPMLHKRCNHCLIAVNGILYAIGGSGENGDALNNVECFYTGQDFWIEAACLLTPRSHFACVLFENSIFATCGKNVEPLCTIERYDIFLNNWQLMDNYKFSGSRYAHSAAIYQNHILLIGGRNSKREAIDTVHKLNLLANTNIWHEASNLIQPRMGLVSTTIKLY